MALKSLSDERRKEMEEEMNRFELEIAGPGETKSPAIINIPSSKPLSPPPAPPVVAVLIPEVLKRPPPPPPPSESPPLQAPPVMTGAPEVCSDAPPRSLQQPMQPPPAPPLAPPPQQPVLPSVRFIPHQLHRQHPRPQARPNFPVPFHGPPMGSGFVPGPMMGPMHGMHPGPPMMMPPGAMGMPPMMPPMMNMRVPLPMPPGFCPMAPARFESRSFPIHESECMNVEADVAAEVPESSADDASAVTAPTVYAAPFVKSQGEVSDSVAANSPAQKLTVTSSIVHKPEKSMSFKVSNEHTIGPSVLPNHVGEEPVVSKKKEKKKKTVRMAGGIAWEDNSLIEWDSDDFRIFCGDLGNDVTDEVLIRAFSKYASFVKAKVIRDKRTNKTKGFGFVSFKDPQDFIKAMREMNGRYVGSRPIKLRKSTWKDRNIDIVKKKQREKEKLGLL